MPFTVGTPVNVFSPEVAMVRLLNIVAGVMVCAAPPKITVLLLAIKLVPVPAHTVPVKFAFIVLEPPSSVPLVRVMAPVNVCVSALPIFNVTPSPFMVSAAALKLLCTVAVPPVLVTLILPVVVNPAIL